MNKIKLVLLLSTVCMTMHAGNWFDSLRKTIDKNRGYTVLAVAGLSAGAYLWSKRLTPIVATKQQVAVPIYETYTNLGNLGNIVGHALQWRLIPATGSLANSPFCTWSSLGSFALGLGALGKLGYEWWRAR